MKLSQPGRNLKTVCINFAHRLPMLYCYSNIFKNFGLVVLLKPSPIFKSAASQFLQGNENWI